MMRRSTLVAAVVLAIASAGAVIGHAAQAPFTLDQILGYPFPDHLVASPAGTAIAWTFNERGLRNIYVANGPGFKPRRLTRYTEDDGQEITSLSYSSDGRYLVYARGGNHDANSSPDEKRLAPNPAGNPVQPKMQVWSITTSVGDLKLLGDGDAPAIAPRTHRVAFVKDGHVWIAPVDGSKAAESLSLLGTGETPAWSPDGNTLAFASNRGDHRFIALFTAMDQPIRYVAPSMSRDSAPEWSPDGAEIAFVREPGMGSVPWTSLAWQPGPWAIWVVKVATGSAREVWKSGSKFIDSLPNAYGGANLHWGADRLVFLSYKDGWPHLYSIPTSGGAELLLTPGKFMVEHVSMAPDRRSIVYSANTGSDRDDIDRRHLFRVPVDASSPAQITKGRGIEWSPVHMADGKTLAYLAADAQRPPLPTIFPLDGRPARALADDHLPVDFPISKIVTPESVVVRTQDAFEIHGQVLKTTEGEARRPALVFVHGGPAQQMLLGWHYTYYYANAYALGQYLANRGFIVMSVNYRLGVGYGHAFQYPDRTGAQGAAEYQDVLAAAEYLQTRPDVDPKRIGIWGGSYGGYLASLGLARNSSVFAAGVNVHGVQDLVMKELDTIASSGDPTGETTVEVPTWTSPVLLIHADDDRNVPFRLTLDLDQRLASNGVKVEAQVIPDDVHDFLLFRSWKTVITAVSDFFERTLLAPTAAAPPTAIPSAPPARR